MELNSEENKGENRRRRRRVGLIHDERMCKHFTPDDDYHPENPNRILAIWNKLKSSGITQRCVVLSAKEAEDKYIAAVHTKNHIDLIKNISSKKFDSRREKIAGKYNSIYFNEGSSEAAYLAAGSVLEVAERVAKGDLDSAFAIVRPPGHHAEENEPMGFCLHNNVAVATSFLLNKKELGIKKIMIVDWDVHHGNGTQKMFWKDPRVLFFSVHRYEFGSFYPASEDGSHIMIGEGPGAGYNINVPWEGGRCGDADYIAAWDHVLIPVAKEFTPDIIMISAGFDAAVGDPLGGCRVTPYGYSVMLKKLMEFAQGKIVMALEGGYNLDSLANSVLACVEVLVEDKPLTGSSEAYPFESTWRVIQEVREVLSPFWPTLKDELSKTLTHRKAPPIQVSSDSGTSLQGLRKGGQMGRIFGNVGEGLDIPLDDLSDVGLLAMDPGRGRLVPRSSHRHGMGKQLRDIPRPSSTEVLMNEESLEEDDSANNCSNESDGSELESEMGERRECEVEKAKSRNSGLEEGLTAEVVFASKEVARPKDIDSSSSQVDGGESAPLMETSFAQLGKNLDSAASTTSKVPFGFAAFGTASSPTEGAGDLVPSALGGVGGALATPCGSTSEVVTDSAMEEKDGEFIVVRHDDGSVELKKGCESVTVKLEYFDGVEDSFRRRVLYIFQIHPSTFVGLGALSAVVRRYVLGLFGLYLECLDCIKLSTARVDDLELLHKKLTSLKDDGLEVKWLFDRNERLVAQLEAVRWRDKVEQLRASLKVAMGTVARLEENLGKAKAIVDGLKEDEAFCVEKLNAASKLAISKFDLDGSAGQGLSG